MRIGRSTEFAAAAAAALLLAATAHGASAQTVEVTNETAGQHCSDFTMVNHEAVGASCTVRIVSEGTSVLWFHDGMTEYPFSACGYELEAAFNEDGDGYVYDQSLTPEGGICGREPCEEPEAGTTPHRNLAWPATLTEVGGSPRLTVELCVALHSSEPTDEGTMGTPCLIDVPLTDDGDHDWEVTTAEIDQIGNGGTPCENLEGQVELDLHWLVAPDQDHPDSIEVGAPPPPPSVEVSDEDTGEHCSDFTMVDHLPVGATCTLRIVGERPFSFWLHSGMAEIQFTQCNSVFEAAFNEDGQGYIYNQILSPEGGACFREPCDEAESGGAPHRNLPWPATLAETGGDLVLLMTLCFYAHSSAPASEGTAGSPCILELLVADEGDHDWEIGTPAMDQAGNGGAPCLNLGGAIEFDGHWLVEPNEAHPNSVEVAHL